MDAAQARVGGGDVEWSLAFQSRSGGPSMPWLEPDIRDALQVAANRGRTHCVVVPIGFVSDHIEVLWDLDEQARAHAATIGVTMVRVATPGTDPRFVSALAEVVVEALSLPSTEVAASLCDPTCCRNARADLPVVDAV
jgi:ferrochelatase